MAKLFQQIIYDPAAVQRDLKAFAKLLQSKVFLAEREDVLPFFRRRKQLAAFIGTYALNIGPATELSFRSWGIFERIW